MTPPTPEQHAAAPGVTPELGRLHAKRISLMAHRTSYLVRYAAALEAGELIRLPGLLHGAEGQQRLIEMTDAQIAAARSGRRYRVSRRRGSVTW